MSFKSISPPVNRFLLVGLGGCMLLAFAPLMVYHLQGLWAEEYYQYFPFIFAAVAYFMWERWDAAEPTVDSRLSRVLFGTALTAGVLCLVAATIVWSPWLAAVAFVLVLGAGALEVYRTHGRITNQFGIWCLLWLIVPVPLQFDQRFVVFLQQVSANLSSHVLDLLGIDHLMLGTVLELPDKQFFVDEACSGIVSVMSVIAAGAIYVVWKNRTLPHVILLLVCGIGWAVVMNIGRITIIAIAHAWWETDLSTGWQHQVLGLILFTLTFVALVSTDQFLAFVNDPIQLKAADREYMHNPLVRAWNAVVTAFDPKRPLALVTAAGAVPTAPPTPNAGMTQPSSVSVEEGEQASKPSARQVRGVSARMVCATSCVLAALGIVQLFVLTRGYRDSESPVELAMSIDAGLLPDELGSWEKEDFQEVEREAFNEFGNYSKQFTYRHRETNQTATLSLDFPYRGGWHELSVCYRNFGWPLLDRTVSDHTVGEGPRAADHWTVISANYQKPEGRYGYLAFSGTNGSGECLEPPSALVLWRPWFRLRRRLLHRISPRFFQFQAWVDSEQPIAEETKADVMDLFLHARPYVLNRLDSAAASGLSDTN